MYRIRKTSNFLGLNVEDMDRLQQYLKNLDTDVKNLVLISNPQTKYGTGTTNQVLSMGVDGSSVGFSSFAGIGAGSMSTVKEGGVQVGDADIVTLDFDGDDFNLTESPDTEINIVIDDSGIDHGGLSGLSSGADHSFIDQDVTANSTPTLNKITGVDAQVNLDMSVNGNADLVADVNIDLNSPIITFPNATKPKKSIWLAAGGAILPTSGAAELQDFAGTNFTYRTLAFDENTDETCFWYFPIPDNFTGTTVTLTVFWTADSGTATRGVSWKFDSGGFANDEAFKTGALGGTEIEVEDAMIATGDMHIATSGAFTCDWTAGDYGVLKCFRDVDAFSGTNLDADALLLFVKVEFSIATLGE